MNCSSKRSPCKWSVAALYIVAGLAGLVALRPIWDVDIFWHIAAGRWIVEHRSFPTQDVFSFVDPPRDWVTFQWLYEVLCYAVDNWAGLTGVRVLHSSLTALAFAAFAWFAVRYLGQRGVARERVVSLAFLLLALLFALYADRVRVRPHVFNLLFWSVALNILLTMRNRILLRATLLAVVMLLWSNLHAGGSFIFLLVLAAWPVAALLVRRLGRPGGRWEAALGSVREGTIFWGLAAVMALVSPNWLRGVAQAYTMLGGSEALIEEWLPFWHYFAIASNPLHVAAGLAPLVGLAGVLAAVRFGRTARLEALLAALGLTLLPFRSARFVYLVAFSAVLIAPYLPVLWAGAQRKWVDAVLVSVVVCAFGATLDYHSRVQFGSIGGYIESFQSDLDERRFPIEFDALVADMARDREQPLKIFCQPNWGGYLLYGHHPRVRVLADGRGNFSEDLGNRLHFIYLYRHDPRYGAAIEKIYDESGADLLIMQNPVVPKGHHLLHWQRVAASAKGQVLVAK